MTSRPQSFPPLYREVDTISLDAYNRVVEELDKTKRELKRARQKIAHLLKEQK